MNTNKNYKINVLNFEEKSIEKIIIFLHENILHSKQITTWIYKKNISKFDLMTNIKYSLIRKLKKIADVINLKIDHEYIDNDNTIKWLINIKKYIIETVAIPNSKNHFTLCLSSQIGCALGCKFCATGKLGFLKNLKPYEIVSQVMIAATQIKKLFHKKNITNIVLMGMGEPLLNLDNVLSFIKIISNQHGLNINKNKITVSTSGITPNIKKLANYNIPLALSLHATTQNKRSKLMPINKKYKLKDLLTACRIYSQKNKLTLEYILLNNINDTIKDAENLLKIAKNMQCKICLIPFNKIDNSDFTTPILEKIIAFQKILKTNGIITTIRKTRGLNIDAACGQLAGKKNNI